MRKPEKGNESDEPVSSIEETSTIPDPMVDPDEYLRKRGFQPTEANSFFPLDLAKWAQEHPPKPEPTVTPGGRPIKNSVNSPIEVQYLTPRPPGDVVIPGKMGRTFCPGKKDLSGRSGAWNRDTDLDLARLRQEYGVQVLFCLLEYDEMVDIKAESLLLKAEHHGMRLIWYPIQDTRVPTDVFSFIRLVEKVIGCLTRGRTTAHFCRGGIGRSGVLATATLIGLGYEPKDAITEVRAKHHRHALENPLQEKWITDFFPMAWKYSRKVMKRDARRE